MATTGPAIIRCKRIYEARERTDGRRVLVDRVWPRGMTREAASIDEWMKEIGPSRALRSWFAHRTDRWPEFVRRYRDELNEASAAELLRRLLDAAHKGPLTLLYSARDESQNQAVVIASVLEDMRRGNA